MQTIQLLGTAMGIGFVSGINLYATVLVIGLGVNTGLIHLSPHLSGLGTLGHPLPTPCLIPLNLRMLL